MQTPARCSAAIAAAAAAAHWIASPSFEKESGLFKTAHGEASKGANQDATIRRLSDWLVSRGADMSLVEVKESKVREHRATHHRPHVIRHALQVGAGAGLGLFVSASATGEDLKPCSAARRPRWWWPFGGGGPNAQRPLATFPLSSAITANNILSDPATGKGYAWMLERGVVDERTIVMAFLIAERVKGAASVIAPWIDALPQT